MLKQKYPDIEAKVRIEQDGNMIRMQIETHDGQKEIIEKALEEYTLVVIDKKQPESLLENQLHVMALKNKLEMANMEVRQTKELLMITKENFSARVSSLEEDLIFLRKQIGAQMLHMDKSQGIIEQQIAKEEKILITHITGTNRLVRDLIQEGWHSKQLTDALVYINDRLESGNITEKDETEVKNALTTVQATSPEIFDELAIAVTNTLYGVSGNIVYQWLVSIGLLLT